MSNFDRCLKRTLKWEGGNDDDPQDPGGRTSRGILQREYDRYRDGKGLPRGDVWRASDDEIRDIYRLNYWEKIDGDRYDPGVAMCLFDAAVLHGVGQTAKWAQRAAGPAYSEAVNSYFGPATMDAITKVPDNDLFIADVCKRRVEMMRGLKHGPKYIKGWTARVNDIQAVAQAWASGSVGPEPASAPEAGDVPQPKAKPADLPPPPSKAPGQTSTILGAIIAALAAWAQQVGSAAKSLADHLQPAADILPVVAKAAAVLVVVGVVATFAAHVAAKRHEALKNGGA